MIRINLIPVKRAKKVYSIVTQLILFIVILVVIAIVLVFIDGIKRQKKDELFIQVGDVNLKIDKIKRQISDHSQIKSNIEKIEYKQKIIDDLESRRSGPAYFLIELSNILSKTKGPHINPQRYQSIITVDRSDGYNPTWDGQRLWLSSILEENREVDIKGDALSNQDVSEFLRRLELSDFFYNVNLVETSQREFDVSKLLPATKQGQSSAATKANYTVISFQIHCRVRYGQVEQPEEENKEPQETQTKTNNGV